MSSSRSESVMSACELKIPEMSPPLKMYVHASGDAFISNSIAKEGIWEKAETRLLLTLLRPGDIFVDVGANIGYFSLVASRLVGDDGAVLAFEPEAVNFSLLEENCRLNHCENVDCVNAAVGEDDAEGTIFLSDINKGDHSICPGEERAESQPINIINGSSFIARHHSRINFIKIDSQGYESQVVEGLLPLMKASLPELLIILEFSPVHLEHAGSSSTELMDKLGQLSGCCFYIPDPHTDGVLQVSHNEIRALGKLAVRGSKQECFANLLITGRPLSREDDIEIIDNLGMYETKLSYILLRGNLRAWSGEVCEVTNSHQFLYFASGWNFAESWGRWTNGDRSIIKFIPSAASRSMTAPLLRIQGRYSDPSATTDIRLNGRRVGTFSLADGHIPVPAELMRNESHICLELHHNIGIEDSQRDNVEDRTRIKFGLERMWLAHHEV